jgi:hypothetical protein
MQGGVVVDPKTGKLKAKFPDAFDPTDPFAGLIDGLFDDAKIELIDEDTEGYTKQKRRSTAEVKQKRRSAAEIKQKRRGSIVEVADKAVWEEVADKAPELAEMREDQKSGAVAAIEMRRRSITEDTSLSDKEKEDMIASLNRELAMLTEHMDKEMGALYNQISGFQSDDRLFEDRKEVERLRLALDEAESELAKLDATFGSQDSSLEALLDMQESLDFSTLDSGQHRRSRAGMPRPSASAKKFFNLAEQEKQLATVRDESVRQVLQVSLEKKKALQKELQAAEGRQELTQAERQSKVKALQVELRQMAQSNLRELQVQSKEERERKREELEQVSLPTVPRHAFLCLVLGADLYSPFLSALILLLFFFSGPGGQGKGGTGEAADLGCIRRGGRRPRQHARRCQWRCNNQLSQPIHARKGGYGAEEGSHRA